MSTNKPNEGVRAREAHASGRRACCARSFFTMAKFFGRSGAWMGAVAAGVMLGAGMTMYSANALPQATQAQPTKVAMIDIMVLINGLTELEDRNAQTKAAREAFLKQLEADEAQIKLLEDEVKAGAQPGQAYAQMEKIAELQERKATFKVRQEKILSLLDLRNAQNIRDLYTKAQAAIEQVAKADGYDLVILDDRPVTLSPNGNGGVLNDEILKKRVLYANDATINITQRVLTVMQNDYAAGKQGGAAPATGNK